MLQKFYSCLLFLSLISLLYFYIFLLFLLSFSSLSSLLNICLVVHSIITTFYSSFYSKNFLIIGVVSSIAVFYIYLFVSLLVSDFQCSWCDFWKKTDIIIIIIIFLYLPSLDFWVQSKRVMPNSLHCDCRKNFPTIDLVFNIIGFCTFRPF